MSRRRRTTGWDARGETIWKWLIRFSAIAALFYVLIALRGEVPLGFYVLIGGWGYTPNIVALQRKLSSQITDDSEED